MKMSTKFHQYATLCVARMGWKIFPLRPRDKRPLTVHGFKDASSNPEQIDRWWISNPKAGVGLPTGKENGIIVIDFDPRNAGVEEVDEDGNEYSRDAYEMAHDLFGTELPDTWIVETPGGGLHFYFKHPGDRVVPGLKGWKPGIDIKSDGGYVCAPPSIHPNGGEYIWAQKPTAGPIAELPATVEAEMATAQRKQVEREMKGDLGDGKIPSGNRNDALTSLAGSMRRRNMDPEAILAALLAENQVKCNPPLDEDEVLAIVNSVGRYEADPDASPKTVASKQREISVVDIATMIGPPPDIEWIIPSRLARGDCAIIVGPPGCGKSWVTMDLAVSGALGGKILGEWQVSKPLRVLYVDEENPVDEVNRRLHGIFNATVSNGQRPKAALDLAARLHVFTPCQGFTFREKEGWIVPLAGMVSSIEPDLIIFDSMTAVSGIIDENKATEVRAFFHDKLYPLRRICNSAILCVHHSNKKAYETEGNETTVKDGQIRGSIDYLGAVDACLFAGAAKGDDGKVARRTLHQAKQLRDSEPGAVDWELVASTDESGLLCLRPLVVTRIDAGGQASGFGVSTPGIVPRFATMSKAEVVRWAMQQWPKMANTEWSDALHLKLVAATNREDISASYVRRVIGQTA
jgi:hypothetical protein